MYKDKIKLNCICGDNKYYYWHVDDSEPADDCNREHNKNKCDSHDCDKCHRHNCKKVCLTGAIGTTGPAINSILNGTITSNKMSIPVGSNIIYDTVNIVGPDYSYDSTTGVFTINTTGIYIIDWKFSVSPNPLTTSIQIDLEKVSGSTFVGGISIIATNPTMNGTMVGYIAKAGDLLQFVNNSNGPISIAFTCATGPTGTVCMIRVA